jgi:aryl carrier-like protein
MHAPITIDCVLFSMTLLLGCARLHVEVDQRGAVTAIVDGEGETVRGRSVGARLLTCTAATSRWNPGGGSGGGESAATGSRQLPAAAAAASALFAATRGGGVASSAVLTYAVAQRGCGAGDGQLGAAGVVPLMFAGSGAGDPAMLAAVAAAWLPDLVDDDMDALGDKHDAIGTRVNAAAGGGSMSGTAVCGAWTLSAARTRAITCTIVAAEVAPLLPTQHQQEDGDGEGETETGMEVVVGGPRGPPPTGTGATNQVAVRLLRWGAAASAYWRPAETASVHQLGDYSDTEESEGDGQSVRADAAMAAAAAAARAATEAATLRDVLAVLNAAPHFDEEPVGRDTNLMEAGFDSLQVVDLRRQLQAAAPAGTAALTASALMEHPTAAGLVAHMMQTWHPSPPVTAAAAAATATATSSPRGGGKKRRTRGRDTPPASSAVAAGTLDRGGGGGQALAISILGVLLLLLVVMCSLLGASLIRQGRRVRAGQALLRAMEEEGRGLPTCGTPNAPVEVEVEVDAGAGRAGRGHRRRVKGHRGRAKENEF